MTETAAKIDRPGIDNIDPEAAKGGQKVAVYGKHLGGVTKITFTDRDSHAKDATFTVKSNDELEVVVPVGLNAGPATVTATNKSGASKPPYDFTILPG
ncbi:IPT/TIG domain-containing protein [Kitasatospora sp. NPDC086801]|uniref:IPT/TIG domain-containing protein n=1 Tax=Kitasatospora sp. NPDC086801 TaxID=3364066 RepID=UPI0037FA1DDB